MQTSIMQVHTKFDTHCVYFGEILPDESNYRA